MKKPRKKYNMNVYYKMRNRSMRRRKNNRSRSVKSITKRNIRGGNPEESNIAPLEQSNVAVVAPTDPTCSWWKRTFYGCPPVVGGRKKRNMSAKKRNVSFK